MALKKTISILFITDDQKQPFSIKMGLFWFKVSAVSLIVSSVIFVVGIIVYFKLVSIAMDYNNLQEKYALSLKQNNQVVGLMRKFAQIQSMDANIRQNLGMQLGIGEALAEGSEDIDLDVPVSYEIDYTPVPRTASVMLNQPADLESIPSILPLEGFITRGFRLSEGNTDEDHLGIDIVAKEGSIVAASGDGIILFANWTYESGNFVIIDHGNGYLSFYKHNLKNLVSERQFVRRGEPLALLGNSGISSGPHLHFEVWKDGQPVDPRTLILNL